MGRSLSRVNGKVTKEKEKGGSFITVSSECQNQHTLQTIDKQIQLATISLAILYLLLRLEYYVHSLARPSPGPLVPSSTPDEACLLICLDDTHMCASHQMSHCLIIRSATSSSAHIPFFSLALAQLAQIPWNGDDLFLTLSPLSSSQWAWGVGWPEGVEECEASGPPCMWPTHLPLASLLMQPTLVCTC